MSSDYFPVRLGLRDVRQAQPISAYGVPPIAAGRFGMGALFHAIGGVAGGPAAAVCVLPWEGPIRFAGRSSDVVLHRWADLLEDRGQVAPVLGNVPAVFSIVADPGCLFLQ